MESWILRWECHRILVHFCMGLSWNNHRTGFSFYNGFSVLCHVFHCFAFMRQFFPWRWLLALLPPSELFFLIFTRLCAHPHPPGWPIMFGDSVVIRRLAHNPPCMDNSLSNVELWPNQTNGTIINDGKVMECRLPSGKLSHNYGKSPFFLGKSTANGPCSMANY